MAVNNNLARQQNRPSFSTFMASPAVKQKVYDIVTGERGDRFITSIITAVGTNPALMDCDYSSILSAALLGESLNLSPSPQLGHFYMVPYKNNKRGVSEAQFQLGYKGYIQLAIRSGQYRDIDVISVKEGELIAYDPFTKKAEFEAIIDPIKREKAMTIGYFAYFTLLNGFTKQLYWTKEQMEAHARQYSPGYAGDLKRGTKYTFWSKDFDGMAHKTMIRQLISKWGIMSIDMTTGFSSDMSTVNITEDGTFEFPVHDGNETLPNDAGDFGDETIGNYKDIKDEAKDELLPFDLDGELPPDLEDKFFGEGAK